VAAVAEGAGGGAGAEDRPSGVEARFAALALLSSISAAASSALFRGSIILRFMNGRLSIGFNSCWFKSMRK
jgi:hypothetical protein